MSDKSNNFQGIPLKDIQNPVDEMYRKNQPEFGIPLKELNKMKEGK